MTDATLVARGAWRFRGSVEWLRFDDILGPRGRTTVPLGASFTGFIDANSLPLLEPAQSAAQFLARSPTLQLGLGTIRTTADSRVARVPISVEYGWRDRLSLGLMIPIVQTRTVITTQLNGRGDSSANIGPNPAAYFRSSTAWATNASVVSALDNASQQLSQRIAACTATPTASGCPAFNARLAEANALVAEAQQFADASETLYGTSGAIAPGSLFVPLAGSVAQQAIDAHLAALRSSFSSFGFNAGSSAFAAAKGRAANTQLQDLVSGDDIGIGLDSIGTTDVIAIGDVELSAVAALSNTFPDTAAGIHYRGVLGGVVRLGTGHPPRGGRPLDVGTGDGQTDLELRTAVDLSIGSRMLTTVAGTYTLPLGSVNYEHLPQAAGTFFLFDVPLPGSLAPGAMASGRINSRFLITRAVSIGGLATIAWRSHDVATPSDSGFTPYDVTTGATTWSLGGTFSYSNLATHSGVGDASFPVEITFSHLELVGATAGGLPRTRRDAIELRYYLRARR